MIQTWTVTHALLESDDYVNSVAFSPDGSMLAVGTDQSEMSYLFRLGHAHGLLCAAVC